MTGLEPATSGVTGRRSNQLSYIRVGREQMSGAVFNSGLGWVATNFREGGANDGTRTRDLRRDRPAL